MTRSFEQAEQNDQQQPPAALPYLSGAFRDYWPRLEDMLATVGTSLDEVGYGINSPSPDPIKLSKAEAKAMAMDVTLFIVDQLENEVPWLQHPFDLDTPLGQAGIVFNWHGTMVGPKVARIIGSDRSGRIFPSTSYNPDTAPTAKLVLIILARAISAATVIMEEKPAAIDELLPVVYKMAKLLNYVRTRIPQAVDAIRPGFDEPEYAEFINQFYDESPPIDPIADNSWIIGHRAPSE